MADQKRKVLRLNRYNSDGSARTGLIELIVRDPTTGEELRNDDGTPAVLIKLNAISEEERRQIVKEHTTLERDPNGGRGLFELVDNKGVTDEVLRRAVHSWEGIAGADDRPLVCNPSTKVLLDAFLQVQITRKLFNAEAAEVLAASFR